jgi:hypothetical protein
VYVVGAGFLAVAAGGVLVVIVRFLRWLCMRELTLSDQRTAIEAVMGQEPQQRLRVRWATADDKVRGKA